MLEHCMAHSQLHAWDTHRGITERHIPVSRIGRSVPMEGCEVVDYCPDCLENDELVVMEKHECPVCGLWHVGHKEMGW